LLSLVVAAAAITLAAAVARVDSAQAPHFL
jgi:hypothetical protein